MKKLMTLWLKFGHALGNLVADFVFTLVFVFLIGTASIIGKIFRRKKEEKCSWQKKVYTDPTLENLGHLF